MKTIREMIEDGLSVLRALDEKADRILQQLTEGGEPEASPDLTAFVQQLNAIAQRDAAVTAQLVALSEQQ